MVQVADNSYGKNRIWPWIFWLLVSQSKLFVLHCMYMTVHCGFGPNLNPFKDLAFDLRLKPAKDSVLMPNPKVLVKFNRHVTLGSSPYGVWVGLKRKQL